MKERILEIEKGSTRSLSVENSLWKGLWTCRETDYRMKMTCYEVLLNRMAVFFS